MQSKNHALITLDLNTIDPEGRRKRKTYRIISATIFAQAALKPPALARRATGHRPRGMLATGPENAATYSATWYCMKLYMIWYDCSYEEVMVELNFADRAEKKAKHPRRKA